MIVDNLSHNACNEAYCLIMAYIREDKMAAKYDKDHLKEFAKFLADVLKNPKNFRVQLEEADEEVTIEDTGNGDPLPL